MGEWVLVLGRGRCNLELGVNHRDREQKGEGEEEGKREGEGEGEREGEREGGRE